MYVRLLLVDCPDLGPLFDLRKADGDDVPRREWQGLLPGPKREPDLFSVSPVINY